MARTSATYVSWHHSQTFPDMSNRPSWFGAFGFGRRRWSGPVWHVVHLHLAPPPRGAPGLEGRPPRHAVEPAGDPFAWHDRRGLAGEDQEGRLEGVFGVLAVAEQAAAHAPDQRAQRADQGREHSLAAVPDEAAEKLTVGHFLGLWGAQDP